MTIYPIPLAGNGEIVKSDTISPGATGDYQAQWSDTYFVSTNTDENNNVYKNIYIGSISIIDGTGWDLSESDLDYQANFKYYPSAEKEITIGGCEEPIPYDPEFICNTPTQTTTTTQPAETGILYRNPPGVINRPLLDEGRYEHERTTIFRYSSIGDFEDAYRNLDRSSEEHPLTDDRSVISNSIINDFVTERWWEEPFAIITPENPSTSGDSSTEPSEPSEPSDSDQITKPNKFKKKSADKITNFKPSTDTLAIDTDSFGIDSSATFATGKNKKTVKKQLAKLDVDFLYDQKKGGLYFNENGADKGFGDGGIIAILKGSPDLTSSNLEFV